MRKTVLVAGIIVSVWMFGSCTHTEEEEVVYRVPHQNHSANAVLWHQTAAEYRALCYQIYNMAKVQLDKKLQQHAYPYDLPPAIVMDLDETVVDNSFFNAQLILDSATFSKERWKQWSDLRNAGQIPGAVDFIKYARSKGVEVIFISNRRVNEIANTKVNLEKIGLEADTAHFYFRTDKSTKEPRRQEVLKKYDVLMYFGDNLADFMEDFDKRSVEVRKQLVDSLQLRFGADFIVLPNALYGEWETALFNYRYDWSAAQKDSIRKSWLLGY